MADATKQRLWHFLGCLFVYKKRRGHNSGLSLWDSSA